MEITIKDFMLKQPNYPEVAESDKYYIILANRLAKLITNSRLLINEPEQVRKDVILAAVGYFQDVVADAGVWRSFCTVCKEYYGTPLPLYPIPDDYIESELNEVDLRFVIWYVIEMSRDEQGTLSPFDLAIERTAHLIFTVFDAEYDDAPVPVELQMAFDVDLNDESEAQRIYDLSYWLFWDCWFLRPAAREPLRRAAIEARRIIKENPREDDARQLLAELNRNVMIESVTGPLALPIGEWLRLIVDGVMPKLDIAPNATPSEEPHKYYTALLNATGGKEIAFINSYDALEAFLSDQMGWGPSAEGHLPSLREADNFVILGNRAKGILIAPNVAQYLAQPDNPLYDPAVAAAEAHTLVTTPGRVPFDLLRYAFANGMLPDARLPHDTLTPHHGSNPTAGRESTAGNLLHSNWDFLSRLYLGPYSRPD